MSALHHYTTEQVVEQVELEYAIQLAETVDWIRTAVKSYQPSVMCHSLNFANDLVSELSGLGIDRSTYVIWVHHV